jgi:isocitrate dehydrogenase
VSTPAKEAGSAAPGPAGSRVPVSVAFGDGIGPEIMAATLEVLDAAGAPLEVEPIEIGRDVYLRGVSSGIAPEAWESLRRTSVLLKAPITTPEGGGYKSLNVTIRKTLGLFANVRPCKAYAPFVPSLHPGLDVVIVRENEEDTYGGIEHRQTDEVTQCLKLITRPGSERIARYAFEYARANGRRKVSCFTKDNIMKLTDGLFRRVFEEVAAEYPDIDHEHLIIDIGTARIADTPERFDVVLAPNLYGDILSDVVAQLTGSVGLGGSANVGERCAMFEAIHGSAPDIAGQDVANPSGLMLAAVAMLVHVGCPEVATRVHNAWLATIEDGVMTPDLAERAEADRRSHPTRAQEDDLPPVRRVGTKAFAEAVAERLGRRPRRLAAVEYPAHAKPIRVEYHRRPRAKKTRLGVDVFVDWEPGDPEMLAKILQEAAGGVLRLVMITNRGQKVWPGGLEETFCTDHWRCRFEAPGAGGEVPAETMVELLRRLVAAGVDVIKTEGLFAFDGEPGFSLGQGQ